MGQVAVPTIPDIILTAVDRLVARNSNGGMAVAVQHVILFGEAAGQNLSVSNVIAQGAFVFDAGLTTLRQVGSIGLGVSAGSALTGDSNTTPQGDGSSVIIGFEAAALAPRIDTVVIIGGGACSTYANAGAAGISNAVILGNEACGNVGGTGGIRDTVIIGQAAAMRRLGTSPAGAGLVLNVIIGDSACRDSQALLSGNIVIGYQAALALATTGAASQNVIIGNTAGGSHERGDDNVSIGSAATIGGTSTAAQGQRNINVGANSVARGSQNVLLGYGAENGSSITTAVGNILIGYNAGNGWTNGDTHKFVIETVGATGSGSVRRGVLFGDLNTGSLITGISTPATDRDLPGTNIHKILNGTTTGVAPVGGGYFRGTAGELRWTSTANVEYVLTPHASRGVFTVATLPAAGLVQGQRAYVTDALAPAFAAAVVGGGAVVTPVYYTGAAWFCG